MNDETTTTMVMMIDRTKKMEEKKNQFVRVCEKKLNKKKINKHA